MGVDRFTKYGHFIHLNYPLSASSVAKILLDTVYKLHGTPSIIIYDRGSIFLGQFWKTLFEVVGSKLLHSTAYHPQTDGKPNV